MGFAKGGELARRVLAQNWLNLGEKLQKWLGNHGHPLYRVMARIRQSFKNNLGRLGK